jgi:toxin ParE1/3/4
MSRIVWTRTAIDDLRAIRAYISRDSVQYAKRMVERIKSAVERLEANPRSGGKVLEWDRDDLREIIVGNYRVIYRIYRRKIQILTVFHAARQLPEQPHGMGIE